MSIKDENEITVKLMCDTEKIYKILEEKGFKIVNKFSMNDIFMIPSQLNIKNMSSREILSNAVLIRDIESQLKKHKSKKITFKRKEFDKDGNILSQSAINCDVINIEDAINLFRAIGYYEIMNIIENDVVYGKDDFELAIKDIKDGDTLIEVETVSNLELDSIEKLKEKLLALDIPIDKNNYFVKKAEIELDKIRK